MNALRISILLLVAVIVSVTLAMFLPWVSAGDVEIIRAGLMITLVRVPLALAILLFTMRAMDWMTHEPFSRALDAMRGKPYALAIYHGARLVGVCLLLAALFG